MRRSKRSTDRPARDDSGSASLEFITAGMILLLPIVYLILVMSEIQGSSLAIEGAARQSARVFVEADTIEDARASAQRAVEFALADYGVDPSEVQVTITCQPEPSQCLTRRGFVTVTIAGAIPLPLVPQVIQINSPVSVPLQATATQQVSRFWGAR